MAAGTNSTADTLRARIPVVNPGKPKAKAKVKAKVKAASAKKAGGKTMKGKAC